MDPVTLAIIGALTLGATSGLSEVGKSLVTDTYEGLKNLLKRKLGLDSKVVEAIGKLEGDPSSPGWRESLGKAISKEGADRDLEITALAEALLDRIKELPGGHQNIQTIIGSYNAQADRGSTATVNIYQRDK